MRWRKCGCGEVTDYISMNFIKTLWGKIMNFFKIDGQGIVDKDSTVLSSDMSEKIRLWNEILKGEAPWNAEAKSCGVVDGIVSSIADPVSEEMRISCENAELEFAMQELHNKASDIVQYMALCGGCVVRPVWNNGLRFEIIRLGNYIPLSYDLDGTLTGAVLLKEFQEKGKTYVLSETHEAVQTQDGYTHGVRLALYKFENETYTAVPLSATSKTAELTQEYAYENVALPMIVEFRNRKSNNVDGSAVPVAIYSGRENLLEDADRQYRRINWEQEAGEKIVFASADLFKTRQGEDGLVVSPKLNKLLVKLSDSGTEDNVNVYSPELRTASQVEAFQEVLRRLEISCKIGKGTLSNLEEARMTATQYTGGKKVLYDTVDTYESELEAKYRKVAYIFAYLLTAYSNIPFDDEITVSYNDSARKDPDQMRQAALLEVQQGIISKAEYRMRIFGESEEEAASKVPAAEPISFGGLFGE